MKIYVTHPATITEEIEVDDKFKVLAEDDILLVENFDDYYNELYDLLLQDERLHLNENNYFIVFDEDGNALIEN